MRLLFVTLLAATLLAACTPTTCVPDGSPACECMPGDSRQCTTDGGAAGLQACGMNGQWTTCAQFMDGGDPDVAPAPDVFIFETGHAE